MLMKLKEAGMAVLVVDHRLYWLEGVADRGSCHARRPRSGRRNILLCCGTLPCGNATACVPTVWTTLE